MAQQTQTDIFRFLNRVDLYGPVYFGSSNDITGLANFYNSASKNATTFQAGNATAAVTYTFPTGAPAANGYQLVSTTGGILSWTNAIVGTATNDNAAAGNVGEYIESVNGSGTNATTSTHWNDVANIALTAGDWNVTMVCLGLSSGATWTSAEAGISTSTGDAFADRAAGSNSNLIQIASSSTAITGFPITVSEYRVSIASSTTYYFKQNWTFSAGTPAMRGRLSARRVR